MKHQLEQDNQIQQIADELFRVEGELNELIVFDRKYKKTARIPAKFQNVSGTGLGWILIIAWRVLLRASRMTSRGPSARSSNPYCSFPQHDLGAAATVLGLLVSLLKYDTLAISVG